MQLADAREMLADARRGFRRGARPSPEPISETTRVPSSQSLTGRSDDLFPERRQDDVSLGEKQREADLVHPARRLRHGRDHAV